MNISPSPTEVILHLASAEEFDRRFGSALLLAGGRRQPARDAGKPGVDVILPLPEAAKLMEDIASAYPDPRGVSVSVTKVSAKGHDPVELGYALNVPTSTRFLLTRSTSMTIGDGLRVGLANWARRVDLGPYEAARRGTLDTAVLSSQGVSIEDDEADAPSSPTP